MSLLDGTDAEYYASAGRDGGEAGRNGGGPCRPDVEAPQRDGGGSGDGGEEAARSGRNDGAPASAAARRASASDLAAIAGVLAGLAVRERPPDPADLERLVGDALSGGAAGEPRGSGAGLGRISDGGDDAGPQPPHSRQGRDGDARDSPPPFVAMLRGAGYLRDGAPGGDSGPRWLTRRGFAAVGDHILRDVMRGMDPLGFGPHETARPGPGSSVIPDQTRRLEPGEPADAGRIDAVRTLLNAVSRAGRGRGGAAAGPFPLDLDPSDIEESEAARDSGAAVVYCIDLSSTMKYRLGGPGGPSRIEAAKRALWALCALARRYFPADHISIVAFASLAARVRPEDIPHLRTFEAGDENLHYTNYQAALRLASRILDREAAGRNRRIVLVTDGQPSACLVETEYQRGRVLSAKPYANLYVPGAEAVRRMGRERAMDFAGLAGAAHLPHDPSTRGAAGHAGTAMVYLCYRHKRIDPVIDECTVREAVRCARRGARIDTIVVSDEPELVEYADSLERRLGGIAYHVSGPGMERLVVRDYLRGASRG